MLERKNAVTSFGISIKTKLLELNKTQNWLIEQVKMLDNSIYIDSSVMVVSLINAIYLLQQEMESGSWLVQVIK